MSYYNEASDSQRFCVIWIAGPAAPLTPRWFLLRTRSSRLRQSMITFLGASHPAVHKPKLPSLSDVLGLIADVDGSLWLRLRRPGLTLLRYDGGIFHDRVAFEDHRNHTLAWLGRRFHRRPQPGAKR